MILLIFVVFFQISCEKDSDLFLEAVIIPENPVDIENVTSNDSLISKTIELSPINDAYVQEGKGYDDKIMRLQPTYRTSYLMFDLSTVKGELENIELKLTVDEDAGDGTIKVFKASHSNWTESKITSTTAPLKESELATISKVYNVGATEKISINKDLLKNEMISFVLTQEDGNDISIVSKENPNSNGPKLVVTYKSSEKGQSTSPDQEPVTEETQTTTTTAVADGFFVTVNGKASNDGLSEATAWSIQHAFSIAKAGDIVYIKAGNYGNVELIASNSGTASNPIKFIGYKLTPGDINSENGATYTYEDYKKNNGLDYSKMPLLQGKRNNAIGVGIGIKIERENFIHIENFMLQYYEYGIFSRGNNNVFKNIISVDQGDFDPSHSAEASGNAFLNLKGNGIWITNGSNNIINNSTIINCGARGIAIVSEEAVNLNYVKVYSDNTTNPTDYYIMTYKSNNGEYNNCTVNRIGKLSHFGHGFSVKVDSKYNSYNNCRAEGTSFELNNRISYNTFKNCHVQGTGDALSGGWEITNYSHDNKFINCSNDSGEGIVFSDWTEQDGNNEVNTAAFNNTFTNCTISNVVPHSGAIIDFHWNQQSGRLTSSAKNNTFENCTFSGADNLFKVDRINSGNKFINCTIKDIKSLRHSRYSNNSSIPLKVIFENTITNNIGFTISGS